MFPIKMVLFTDAGDMIVDVYDVTHVGTGEGTALIWFNNSWSIVGINCLRPIEKTSILCEG